MHELLSWVRDGEYDRIVSGEYIHRGQERPAREEAADAATHYSERFRELFRETGEHVNTAGKQLVGLAEHLSDDDKPGKGSGGSAAPDEMDLTPAEIRVLGCLIEKQRTTPDTYPLTLNALRAACNQSTNRDPVVAYDEATIRDAITRLNRRRWARLSSGAGSRTSKYRHLLDEALTRAPDELAVLCVLMLRGGQTPGELKSAPSACTRSRTWPRCTRRSSG